MNRYTALTATFLAALPAAGIAATVATLDIEGSYDISPNGIGTVASTNGTFAGSLGMTPLDTLGDYTFSAALTLNGNALFSNAITLDDTRLTDVVDDPSGLINAVDGALDGLLVSLQASALDPVLGPLVAYLTTPRIGTETFDLVPGASLFTDVDIDTLTATAITGSYTGELSTAFPLDVAVNDLLDEIDPLNAVFPSSFLFPADSSGTYSIALEISVDPEIAPVPLPATLPLMGAGLLLLGLWRRRAT